MTKPSCVHCGCTIAEGVALHRLSPNGERFGLWACDLHKHRPISAYNILLRERDALREALTRLHAWVLAQEGDCMFSGDHPVAQAAIALYGAPPVSQPQPVAPAGYRMAMHSALVALDRLAIHSADEYDKRVAETALQALRDALAAPVSQQEGKHD